MNKTILIAFLNTISWPIIQICTAFMFNKMHKKAFHNFHLFDFNCTSLFEKIFAIRTWKNKLPDGGLWMKSGFQKTKLLSHNKNYLEDFYNETKRGELAHWAMLAFCPIFFIWNPMWAAWVMIIFGIATNLPCILVQRYNRYRLSKVVKQ